MRHVGLIGELQLLRGILRDVLSFFEREPSRYNRILLLTVIDSVWQVSRGLSGVDEPDEAWLRRYLPDDHAHLSPDHANSFAEDKQIVDDLLWAHGLHTALRHPVTKTAAWSFLLSEPWPMEDTQRLIGTGEAVKQILRSFVLTLDPDTGYDGEVSEKQRLGGG